jgi:hypothetical protein
LTDVDDAVAAIEAGELAIIPTDTVYGLAATPHAEEAVRRLYRAKGRDDRSRRPSSPPTSIAARECLPELPRRRRGRTRAAARAVHADPARTPRGASAG